MRESLPRGKITRQKALMAESYALVDDSLLWMQWNGLGLND